MKNAEQKMFINRLDDLFQNYTDEEINKLTGLQVRSLKNLRLIRSNVPLKNIVKMNDVSIHTLYHLNYNYPRPIFEP